MSQKQKMVTVDVCDTCGADSGYHSKCLICGNAACYECERKGELIEYEHAVSFSGSGDGHYCKACNIAQMKNPSPLFRAFTKIQDLRAESKQFWEDFECRSRAAESNLKALQ